MKVISHYILIESGPKFPCTGMALFDLRHGYCGEAGNPLTAYYSLPTEANEFLKIHFSHVDIVRVLDEVFLWTEEAGPEPLGLVHHHFAYKVQSSRFWNSQSEFYFEIKSKAVHYRFVTGGACLDVLTTIEPTFQLVSSIGDDNPIPPTILNSTR